MSHYVTLPTLCCLTKEETLANFKFDTDLSKLVFENDPFPGYYSILNIPENPIPSFTKSLFLPVHSLGMCHLFEMIRVIHRVMKNFTFKIDPCPAIIDYQNVKHYALRLKYYDIENIPELITAFQKEGMEFLGKKRVEQYSSMINLYKFIEMEPLTETIFVDAKNLDINYVALSQAIEWEDFKQAICFIKNNSTIPSFDAAKCSILTPSKEWQFVRIYRQGGYQLNDLKILEKKIEQFIKAPVTV